MSMRPDSVSSLNLRKKLISVEVMRKGNKDADSDNFKCDSLSYDFKG